MSISIESTVSTLALLVVLGSAAQTFIEYPPMQEGASFNMEAVKEQIQRKLSAAQGN